MTDYKQHLMGDPDLPDLTIFEPNSFVPTHTAANPPDEQQPI